MSVTELRDQQSNEWHAWATKNRDKAIRGALQRQADMQSATLPHAVNDGTPWTDDDFEEAMSDRPVIETALMLGRSYKSVIRARQRVRKMRGLDITYTKTEADKYDGSDRRGFLMPRNSGGTKT